jgi:hypothetical protein
MVVPSSPLQTSPDVGPWESRGYRFTPLAKYQISARVVRTSRYWFGSGSDIGPMDLLLAWGPMSDTANLQKVDFARCNRCMRWTLLDGSLPVKTVSENIANVHIIPANGEVWKDVKGVRREDTVTMTGYLVHVTTDAGYSWKSSTTRTDTGDGSCEVFWVDKLSIDRPKSR